jgi:hypothetical protein
MSRRCGNCKNSVLHDTAYSKKLDKYLDAELGCKVMQCTIEDENTAVKCAEYLCDYQDEDDPEEAEVQKILSKCSN